jgi:hypothetical protein
VDLSESVPDFAELRRRMWTGPIDLKENQTKVLYGRVHWARLKENMRLPRFEEAVRILAERQASA